MPLFRKRLICFYCGKKSHLKFDGSLSEFNCETCEATNYLDSNGDITDPPVQVTETSWNNQYARQRNSDSLTKSPVFCERCLRNQQYHYDVLKQLDVEFDAKHSKYQTYEEKIRLVKKDLDKRYPIVCEDCAPKAQELRDKADKFAKSDWLGRLNALSELIRSQKTWKDTFQNVIYQAFLYPVVSKVWYLVVMGQMIALVLAPFNATKFVGNALKFIPYLSDDLTLNITSFLSSKRYLGWSILCNFLSCSMNPFFSRWHPKGNPKRMIGFFNWYGYQLLLQLVLRVLSCSILESGLFADLSSFSTTIANICSIFFNFLIAYGSRYYLGPKKIPLWKSTPGPIYTPPMFENSEGSGNSMSDILDEIMFSTSKTHEQVPSPPASHTQRSSPNSQEQAYKHDHQSHASGLPEKPFANTFSQNYNRNREGPRQTELLLKTATSGLNYAELDRYLTTGQVPDWKLQEGEEMDWDPTVTRVNHEFNIRHRALNTASRHETPVQPFGQSSSPFQSSASFNGPSPFYGKLPAAPISPAHRLRNPPNRPRLDVPSAKRKENFFNSMTQRPAFGKENTDHREIHIADPKLHIENPAAYQLDSTFEEAFGNFSLSDAPKTPTKGIANLSMGKAVGLGLLFGGLAVVAGALYKTNFLAQNEVSSSLEAITIEKTSTL
ncbi:hypothetical protein DSL72_001177 [Monilinia vaccinii-corymbosi]|uniref:Ima1 N-terminal domain-containing protein n=1 Tax=Monilinia vaccinii-corymbosi TaxID=61207 RepID=A0A8A3P4D4_9HELO|nr:hypothetical protein DSL72_001177 [Monilinia vaccinii-corymbosi]